jgi:hypothetical protein
LETIGDLVTLVFLLDHALRLMEESLDLRSAACNSIQKPRAVSLDFQAQGLPWIF